MISVYDAVKETLENDVIVFEAMQREVLNLSAYADQIKPIIEVKTHKQVKLGTIVVALARISKKKTDIAPLIPLVKISNLIIKTPLYEATFDKTTEILDKLTKLSNQIAKQEAYFTITQGISEITVIISQDLKGQFLQELNQSPKSEYHDLVAVTVRFAKDYLQVPNVIYSLISKVATKRINLIEVVSTYTELSFIINKKDLNETVQTLSELA